MKNKISLFKLNYFIKIRNVIIILFLLNNFTSCAAIMRDINNYTPSAENENSDENILGKSARIRGKEILTGSTSQFKIEGEKITKDGAHTGYLIRNGYVYDKNGSRQIGYINSFGDIVITLIE